MTTVASSRGTWIIWFVKMGDIYFACLCFCICMYFFYKLKMHKHLVLVPIQKSINIQKVGDKGAPTNFAGK